MGPPSLSAIYIPIEIATSIGLTVVALFNLKYQSFYKELR